MSDPPKLPEGFSAPPEQPPGVGIVRLDSPDGVMPLDHFTGFGGALDRALYNIGRAPGRYRVDVAFSATVEVRNPGVIIEYIAKLT